MWIGFFVRFDIEYSKYNLYFFLLSFLFLLLYPLSLSCTNDTTKRMTEAKKRKMNQNKHGEAVWVSFSFLKIKNKKKPIQKAAIHKGSQRTINRTTVIGSIYGCH